MDKALTIAINASFLQPKGGGISEYIYNLVSNIIEQDTTNRYILYVLKDMYEFAREKFPRGIRIKTIPFTTGFSDVIKRSLFADRFWREEERMEHFDIFHSPFFHAPKLKQAKVILTVHDLRLYRYPSTYSFLRFVYLYFVVRHSIQRADKIISISEFTKNEIIDTCHVKPDKIQVVHEAINRDDFSEKKINKKDIDGKLKILDGSKYILTVGHVEPRKNYERLIDAFTLLKQKEEANDIKLVIVGKKAHHYKRVMHLIAANKDVIYLNFVSRSSLLWLYKNASLFAFPSFYEGFGFPPLEAACFDTISAVSNASCIPEICGNAAIYYNPFDIEDMCCALYQGLFEKMLIEKQHKALNPNLQRFSWQKNASETIKLYCSLI